MYMKDVGKQLNRRALLKVAGASVAATMGFPAIVRSSAPVRIGLLSPLSGPLAFVGQTAQNCMTLAIREINASGGILGQEVEMIAEDSQMSTSASIDKSRKMISRDGVAMITGMVLPGELQAALQVASAANRMVFFPNFSDGRCHPNRLSIGLQPNQTIEPLTRWVVENVGKKVFVISSDLTNFRTVSVPKIKAGFEAAGGAMLGAQFFPFGTRDFGPVLQQARDANPDVIWHYIGDDPATFIKQYRSFGLKQQLVSEIFNEPLNVHTAGASTGTVGVSSYFMSLTNPANAKFLGDYTTAFTDFTDQRVAGKVVMHPAGESTYVAAKIFAEATQIAGSFEMDKLKSGLETVSLDLPRGPVKVAVAAGHLLCQSYIGRVSADSSVEILVQSPPLAPVCL
jgi:ABC-type branched-subunit amino acid transport system substrate-binding protein